MSGYDRKIQDFEQETEIGFDIGLFPFGIIYAICEEKGYTCIFGGQRDDCGRDK